MCSALKLSGIVRANVRYDGPLMGVWREAVKNKIGIIAWGCMGPYHLLSKAHSQIGLMCDIVMAIGLCECIQL